MALKFVTVKQLHDKTSEILHSIYDGEQEVVITAYGKPKALLCRLTETEFEDYLLTHHPKFKRLLEEAYQEAKAGRLTTLEALVRRTEEELELSRSPNPTG